MKTTHTIKKLLTLAMVAIMSICILGTVAFAAEEGNHSENIIQDEIQPRSGVNIIYPHNKSFTTTKKLTSLTYFVEGYPTNGHVLLKLTNRSDGTYYTFSLFTYYSGTYPTNIEIGTYDLSIIGGNYTSVNSIMLNFS